MKKFLQVLFYIISMGSFTHAQIEWAPIGSEYYYSYFSVFDSDLYYARMVSEKDTLIDEVQTRKLVTYVKTNVFEEEEVLETNYVYQDGKKVFRYIRGDFKLLYDFDLELNDTLKIFVPGEEFNTDTTAYFTIDSIVTSFPVNGNEIIGHYLNPIDQGAVGYAVGFGGWAFEFFGALTYFFPSHDLQCDSYCVCGFRCIETNDFFFQRFTDLSCDSIRFTSTVSELPKKASSSIHPNPTMRSQISFVQIDDQFFGRHYSLSVFDIDGTLISKSNGVIRNTIPIKNPEMPGLHIVRIEVDDIVIIEKLMIK